MNIFSKIVIVIPSLNPDEKLLAVINDCINNGFDNLIIVDDGSDSKNIFNIISKKSECTVLTHACNRGKGMALKTAFRYILEKNTNELCLGCITVDGDGQHRGKDIIVCANVLAEERDSIVLGCRSFTNDNSIGGVNVPTRSKFGNQLTSSIFNIFCGLKISDTQTGLRAIPYKYLNELLKVKGERFEYETNMLLEF